MAERHLILVLLQAAATFGLVLAIWMLGVLAWRRKQALEKDKIARRLAGESIEGLPGDGRALRLWHEGGEAVRYVPGLRKRTSALQRFGFLCSDAGFKSSPKNVLLRVVGSALFLAMAISLVTGKVFPALIAVVAVVMVFWVIINKRATDRTRTFERQLVEALELCARALRAGHPMMASFQLISTEIPAPVGTIFAGVVQQQAMGVRLDEALRRAADEARNPDLDLFAAALSIHSKTGGNLADVMQSLAHIIRERLRLSRRFRVLVAQTQVSKRILIAMPCVMFVVLNFISPDYMAELYGTVTGQFLLGAAAGSLLCGWAIMNKMANLVG
jgi:tight adherence protein B